MCVCSVQDRERERERDTHTHKRRDKEILNKIVKQNERHTLKGETKKDKTKE